VGTTSHSLIIHASTALCNNNPIPLITMGLGVLAAIAMNRQRSAMLTTVDYLFRRSIQTAHHLMTICPFVLFLSLLSYGIRLIFRPRVVPLRSC
jgi:hypothetical protein